jgi:hypothetical protein
MLTPENARWCAIALVAVLFVACPIAWLMERRDQLKQGARLDRSVRPGYVDLYDVPYGEEETP